MTHLRLGFRGVCTALVGIAFGAAATSTLAADLTVGVRSGPMSVDPQFNSNGPDTSAARNVFDALVRRGPGFSLQPNLATSWTRVGANAWEFKLRDGVRWHDGSPFTAADVAFSINRVPLAADKTGGFLAYVKSIAQTVVVDPHTIRFITNGPAATLPAELEEVFMVSEHAVTEAGPDGFQTGKAVIGTGPYRFVSYQRNASEKLERWDGYWGEQKPQWQHVTFTEIPDDGARTAALLSGGVDLINYVPPAVVGSLMKAPHIGIFKGPSIYVYILHPDGRDNSPLVTDLDGKPLAKSPFRDVRVRRAMSMAINREAIARVTMEGLATPARQLMPLNFVGVDPDAPPLPYDPAAARALMAEAGYPSGFRVRLTCTNNRLPNDAAVCAALAPMLERIGIKAEVAALPQAVYFNDFSRGAYSLSMNGWGTMTGDASYMLSSLAFTRDAEPNLGTFNRARYSNPDVDRITKAALSATDPDARVALLRQGMDLLMSDVAFIPIVNLSTVWAGDTDKLRYVPQMNEDTLALATEPVKQ